MQEEQQAHPSSLSSSQRDGWWTSSWWDESWQWTEGYSHGFYFHSLSDSDDPLLADIRVESENTHIAQTTFVTSCTSSLHWQVNTLSSALCPSVVRSLFCVSRTDILESWWCSEIALRVLRRKYSERKVVVPYHFPSLRTSNTPRFCGKRRLVHLSHRMIWHVEISLDRPTPSKDHWVCEVLEKQTSTNDT